MTQTEWQASTDPGPMLACLRDRQLIRSERHWFSRLRAGLPADWSGPAAADRKLWLFALACCARVEGLLARATIPSERLGEQVADPRNALPLAERFLEGGVVDPPWPRDRRYYLPVAVSAADHALSAACYAAVDFFHEDRSDAVFTRRSSLAPRMSAFEAQRIRDSTIVGVLTSYETRLAVAVSAAGPPPANVERQWHEEWNKAASAELAAHAGLVRCLFGNPFGPARVVDPDWLARERGSAPSVASAIYARRAFDQLPILADALEDAGCTDAEVLGHLRGPGPHCRGCWVVDLVTGKS
jgi:hypothetical protein